MADAMDLESVVDIESADNTDMNGAFKTEVEMPTDEKQSIEATKCDEIPDDNSILENQGEGLEEAIQRLLDTMARQPITSDQLRLLEQSSAFLKRKSHVEAFIDAMPQAAELTDVEIRGRFFSLLKIAFMQLPTCEERLQIMDYHFGRNTRLVDFSRFFQNYQAELNQVLNGITSSDGGNVDRVKELTDKLSPFFLLSPESTVWSCFAMALDCPIVFTIIVLILRQVTPIHKLMDSETKTSVILAAIKKVIDQWQTLLLSEEKAAAFTNFLIGLCRSHSAGPSVLDPTVVLQDVVIPMFLKHGIQDSEKRMHFRILLRLVKDNKIKIRWQMEPKTIQSSGEASVELPVLLVFVSKLYNELDPKVPVEMRNQCLQVLQAISACVEKSEVPLSKSVAKWIDQNLSNCSWQLKFVMFAWMNHALVEQHQFKPQVPSCVFNQFVKQRQEKWESIKCSRHSEEECTFQSIIELCLLDGQLAIKSINDLNDITFHSENLSLKLAEIIAGKDLNSWRNFLALIKAIDPVKDIFEDAPPMKKGAFDGIGPVLPYMVLGDAVILALTPAFEGTPRMKLKSANDVVDKFMTLLQELARDIDNSKQSFIKTDMPVAFAYRCRAQISFSHILAMCKKISSAYESFIHTDCSVANKSGDDTELNSTDVPVSLQLLISFAQEKISALKYCGLDLGITTQTAPEQRKFKPHSSDPSKNTNVTAHKNLSISETSRNVVEKGNVPEANEPPITVGCMSLKTINNSATGSKPVTDNLSKLTKEKEQVSDTNGLLTSSVASPELKDDMSKCNAAVVTTGDVASVTPSAVDIPDMTFALSMHSARRGRGIFDVSSYQTKIDKASDSRLCSSGRGHHLVIQSEKPLQGDQVAENVTLHSCTGPETNAEIVETAKTKENISPRVRVALGGFGRGKFSSNQEHDKSHSEEWSNSHDKGQKLKKLDKSEQHSEEYINFNSLNSSADAKSPGRGVLPFAVKRSDLDHFRYQLQGDQSSVSESPLFLDKDFHNYHQVSSQLIESGGKIVSVSNEQDRALSQRLVSATNADANNKQISKSGEECQTGETHVVA